MKHEMRLSTAPNFEMENHHFSLKFYLAKVLCIPRGFCASLFISISHEYSRTNELVNISANDFLHIGKSTQAEATSTKLGRCERTRTQIAIQCDLTFQVATKSRGKFKTGQKLVLFPHHESKYRSTAFLMLLFKIRLTIQFKLLAPLARKQRNIISPPK